MKQVVINEHLEEIEVHPPGLYEQFIDICIAAAKEMLDQRDQFREIDCPACDSPDREPAFEKHGYAYWLCQTCATIFASPRPTEQLLDWYLYASPVAAFRGSQEYQQTMAQRTKELGLYRVEWVTELCGRMRHSGPQPIVDVGTRSATYLTELLKRQVSPVIAAKPLAALGSSYLRARENRLTVVDNLTALAGSQSKLITAFDVLEHQISPFDMILGAYSALRPGGILALTTRSSSGLDIQVLWERATIFPAEHINLMSVEGIRALLKMVGFEILEESTPGQLDVQLIERILQEQPDIETPRFLKYFFTHRDRYARRRLQQFLQQNLLSSYLRVVARKSSV